MAQAVFEFSPTSPSSNASPLGDGSDRNTSGSGRTDAAADPAGAMDRTGFEIGWDHAHHRLTPPLRHLHDHNPVRQGWDSGRVAFGTRTLARSAAVRQWLALRLQAWEQGQVFEDVQVNASFLARIDADACPVSRQPLTLCAGRDSDAVVTRLNPAAAYAAGNLVVLSQRVVDARGDARVDARVDAPGEARTAGALPCGGAGTDAAQPGALSADERARLATLASFATPLAHAQAAALPLRALPPNRVRVINPVQALQVMLTLQFTQAGYARRLLGLAALMPGSEARQAFQIFMHTLLARRLAVGPQASTAALRLALEDSWADTLVLRRWVRLASRLSAADCELLLQRASQRALVVGGTRWVSSASATEGWALESDGTLGQRGRRTDRGPKPATQAATTQAAAASMVARPGSARSLGSQKLAS
jgi:hypothetical protein